MTTQSSISSLEWNLCILFERLSSTHTNQPLTEQPYWSSVQELATLADGGLHPRVWVGELLKRLW